MSIEPTARELLTHIKFGESPVTSITIPDMVAFVDCLKRLDAELNSGEKRATCFSANAAQLEALLLLDGSSATRGLVTVAHHWQTLGEPELPEDDIDGIFTTTKLLSEDVRAVLRRAGGGNLSRGARRLARWVMCGYKR